MIKALFLAFLVAFFPVWCHNVGHCGIEWEKSLSMFRGISTANIDAKGRMAIPVRYRGRIIDARCQVVVTIDTDEKCLLLYPLPEWETIEQQIQALPTFNPVTRRIQRLLMGHATEIELDSSGRVLVPSLLREYAGIQKRVMLVGQGQKIEIWSEDNWQGRCRDWLNEEPLRPEILPPELQTLSL